MKKQGVGMYEIAGDLTVNGKPLEYLGNGTYAIFYDELDKKPQNFNIISKSGEKLSFSIDVPKPVKILRVNGKSEDISINMQEDTLLELDKLPNLSNDEKLRISLIVETLGVRAFSDIGIFKAAEKIKIPSEAFINAQVSSSGMGAKTGVADFRAGKNYLRVERFKMELPDADIPVQTSSLSWSTVPVNLSGKANANPGIEISREYKDQEGKTDLKYDFFKPNAYYSAPISKASKMAVSSLVVRGSLRNVQTSTNTKTVGNMEVTTKTTITRQFPQLPDKYWNELLESLYNSIKYTMKTNYNIELIPVEKVVKAPSYKKLESFNDENNIVKIEKTYKGTKSLLPVSFSGHLNNFSSTISSDRTDTKLMRELDADGLIDLVFELAIDPDSEKIILNPNFQIRILGMPRGYQTVTGGIYTTGTISGKGVPFSESEFTSINALNRITRKGDIMNVLNSALKNLDSEEEKYGYKKIWDLK